MYLIYWLLAGSYPMPAKGDKALLEGALTLEEKTLSNFGEIKGMRESALYENEKSLTNQWRK